MSKHTKGPWAVVGSIPEEGVDCFWINAQPAGGVCRGFTQEIGCVNGHQSNEEQAANARLIAAAPDLLEALENALAYVDDACHFPEQFKRGVVVGHAKQARAAIAKATGEAFPMPGKGWLR